LLTLAATLLAALAITWFDQRTPEPAPTSAPADAFSAGRAAADIAAIGSIAHPVGSAANHTVRDTLVARMAALGLSPQVHHNLGVWPGRGDSGRASVGFVDNVVASCRARPRPCPRSS